MDLVAPHDGLFFWQLSGLVYFGFCLNALFDCLRNEFLDPNQKLIWVILILFTPVIGTFLFLSLSQRTKERRIFNPDFNNTKTQPTENHDLKFCTKSWRGSYDHPPTLLSGLLYPLGLLLGRCHSLQFQGFKHEVDLGSHPIICAWIGANCLSDFGKRI